jgi:hypothetical protein
MLYEGHYVSSPASTTLRAHGAPAGVGAIRQRVARVGGGGWLRRLAPIAQPRRPRARLRRGRSHAVLRPRAELRAHAVDRRHAVRGYGSRSAV